MSTAGREGIIVQCCTACPGGCDKTERSCRCHWYAAPDYPNGPSGHDAARHATTVIVDQPPPTPNERPAVWDLVIADMRERDRVGRERYGTPLQPHNGRDALVDAYQEALDLVVYLRQAISERGVS
jgi:hypothetical protein